MENIIVKGIAYNEQGEKIGKANIALELFPEKAEIYSVSTDKLEYVIKENITLTTVTNLLVDNIQIQYAPSNFPIAKKSQTFEIKNGIKIWTIIFSISTKGDKTFTALCKGVDSEYDEENVLQFDLSFSKK